MSFQKNWKFPACTKISQATPIWLLSNVVYGEIPPQSATFQGTENIPTSAILCHSTCWQPPVPISSDFLTQDSSTEGRSYLIGGLSWLVRRPAVKICWANDSWRGGGGGGRSQFPQKRKRKTCCEMKTNGLQTGGRFAGWRCQSHGFLMPRC